MEPGKRGLLLTIFAICFGLLAISNLLKPLGQMHHDPRAGLVFFGTKLTGTADLIIAPLFAAFLAIYAIGIWRMKRYAMTVAWSYAAYVTLNVTLFTIRNPPPGARSLMIFGVVYSIGAIVLTVGTAIALTRRSADLS